MFPFSKKAPPSKVDVVKKTVSDAAHALIDAVPTDMIEDKLDDLKKTAAQVALHAAQVAHHAGEVASHKLEEWQHTAEAIGESASGAAHRAGESAAATAAVKAKAAKEAAQGAKESAQHARDVLQERAVGLKESAASLKESLQSRAAHDVAVGSKGAQDAKEAVEKAAREQVEAAAAKAEAARAAIADKKSKWDHRKDEIAAKVSDIEDVKFKAPKVEVEYSDSSSKWQWILLGLAVGALLAILFAPTSGRRSRAAIKDRLGKVGEGAADAATTASDKAIDIAHRVEGLAHKIETKVAADTAAEDDGTIADRVRSILGHNDATKHIERLNIDCVDGVVTLRGPLLDGQTITTLIAAVKAIPGVKDVLSDLLIDEEPANPANYAN
jgi:gas vesicle protein